MEELELDSHVNLRRIMAVVEDTLCKALQTTYRLHSSTPRPRSLWPLTGTQSRITTGPNSTTVSFGTTTAIPRLPSQDKVPSPLTRSQYH